MKSNDWRHKNVAPYTPGNTKILYFFNCLLDGMHTTNPYICDFSRGVLNTRSTRSYPTLAPRSQIRILSFSEGCLWLLKQTQNLFLRNLRKFSKDYDFPEQPMHKTLLFFPKNNFSCFQRLLHINNSLIRRTAEFKTNILFFHNKRTIYKIIDLF